MFSCMCVCVCLQEVNHAGSDLEVSLGQVAPLCHKVRDAKHPPVSGAVPIICTQLSSEGGRKKKKELK